MGHVAGRRLTLRPWRAARHPAHHGHAASAGGARPHEATGALVTDISAGLSRQLGRRENDVILQINRLRVRSADETAQAFEAVRGTGRVALIFERDGGRYVREFYWRR